MTRKRMAHILNRLVHGSASSFNQETNVDLTNKYNGSRYLRADRGSIDSGHVYRLGLCLGYRKGEPNGGKSHLRG